jgi:hypothetical protein
MSGAALVLASLVIAAEFPDWEIARLPGPLEAWSAFWSAPDGRSRRYIIKGSPGELLTALRAAA